MREFQIVNRLRIASLSGFLCLALVSIAGAQNPYENIAVTEKNKCRQLQKPAAEAVRSRTSLTSAQKKAINEYLLKCAIAPMATPSAYEDDGSKLVDYRKMVLSALKPGGPAHTEILRLCVQHLIGTRQRAGIAKSDAYSPASRLNAMLLIADLNETEISLQNREPKPLGVARTFMAEVVESKKTKYPQYLRVAALNGLRRHAACGARSNSMMSAVLQILKEEPPSDMPPEAVTWQKRLAIETMGLMEHPGFAKYIGPYVVDKDAPLELRCAAAEAYGRLKFKPGDKAAAQAIIPIGDVAVTACTNEVLRLTEEIDSGESDGGRQPTNFRVGERAVDPVVQRSRRELLGQLNCVGEGIDSVAAVVTGTEKGLATKIADHIKALQKLLSDDAKTMSPIELRAQISTTAGEIESIVRR